MRRTRATLEALERDMWLCQYHLHELQIAEGASDGHHMFGRHVDYPEAIVALCHDCHMKLHNGEIDRDEVVAIQMTRGILTDDLVSRFKCAKIRGTKGRIWD